MSIRTITGLSVLLCITFVQAQTSPPKKTSLVFSTKPVRDSVQYKTPAYRQGVICNFEDQLNRKKVPLNFQLGNSKY